MQGFLQPNYYYDDLSSDEGQPRDLEAAKRHRRGKRSPTRWRTMVQSISRQVHLNLKKHRFSVLGIVLLGLFSLFVLYKYVRGPLLSYFGDTAEGRSYPYAKFTNLVMVAGHAVYTSNKCEKADQEASWFLESYQKHPGQAASLLEHIKVGVKTSAIDENALLIFSGGETRRDAGPRSEAQSYWLVADSKDWFGYSKLVRPKAITEEHARDSFENLLFSICRFREVTGNYPYNITVISYNFKGHRFTDLHRSALRFPASRFNFVGTYPVATTAAEAAKGELHVQEQFQRDPYGCMGSLRIKRLHRDPFSRTIPYPRRCPEIAGLFSYCAPATFNKWLPWDDRKSRHLIGFIQHLK